MPDTLAPESQSPETERPKYAKVRTKPRATYDEAQIHPIIDASLVAHVGFISDGKPMVIPMAFARRGNTLLIHGAKAARIIKQNQEEAALCLTFTLLDGIVCARSGMHHSVNYRSVVAHGNARLITHPKEHAQALVAITEHLLPGRYDEVRADTAKEIAATGILAVEIEWAAAKIRTGGPVDDPEDYDKPIWAGVLPVITALGRPIADTKENAARPVPPSLAAARKKFA
ncbi:pyridoxamine 5'-phosphate oxidase family protein [Polycladidibacter hongkongensis]|uniref:pyridoxamine 5'-phosphate oxidase family protein n=1 Tax=Polycladidibacter hongkongensis TaxID=1647556 RepID=UPI0008343761|nr:pyridoxamine 5'-phosphate oxidase family protein [Pseudovibrio hongkongensis]